MPTREEANPQLNDLLQLISAQLYLSVLLSFSAAASSAHRTDPPAPHASTTHAVELVFWVNEPSATRSQSAPTPDLRQTFTLASIELEPLVSIRDAMGLPPQLDASALRTKLLLPKGELRSSPDAVQGSGTRTEEAATLRSGQRETFSIVVFALPAPATMSSASSSQLPPDHWSLVKIINYELPATDGEPVASVDVPPRLVDQVQRASSDATGSEKGDEEQKSSWRRVILGSLNEDWPADRGTNGPSLKAVAELALLRVMEREQMSLAERQAKDELDSRHITRRMLHVVTPKSSDA